ncbi:YdcF family protein [candidate division WOR-3 bacterium]|nr:YdcF family protein [candidate division WOR-3 bacterium]
MNKFVVIIPGSSSRGITRERVSYAESFLKNRKGFAVIFSGTKNEVEWMKEFSSLPGIIEDHSSTTYDNFLNSKKLIPKVEKIWIVTDSSHFLRARYLAKRIFRNVPFTILVKKMPFPYHIRKIYYETTRFIHNVFL